MERPGKQGVHCPFAIWDRLPAGSSPDLSDGDRTTSAGLGLIMSRWLPLPRQKGTDKGAAGSPLFSTQSAVKCGEGGRLCKMRNRELEEIC